MSTIERDGVEVYYEAQGEGPVILLSHGYGATAQMWAGQLAPLSEHYRVIAWDMRGHGQTASPEDPGCYSEAETVADMAAILDAEGADDAIIGGLSLGGYMSLAFNLVHPERTRALMLFDTGPGYNNPRGREGWNANFAVPRAEALEAARARRAGRVGGGADFDASFRRRPGPRGAWDARAVRQPGDSVARGHRAAHARVGRRER